jgi:hypothetical protein
VFGGRRYGETGCVVDLIGGAALYMSSRKQSGMIM